MEPRSCLGTAFTPMAALCILTRVPVRPFPEVRCIAPEVPPLTLDLRCSITFSSTAAVLHRPVQPRPRLRESGSHSRSASCSMYASGRSRSSGRPGGRRVYRQMEFNLWMSENIDYAIVSLSLPSNIPTKFGKRARRPISSGSMQVHERGSRKGIGR